MRRRTLLTLPALVAGGLSVSACGEDAPVREPDRTGEGRFTYGDDPSQFGELYLPRGEPRGVVVVIHGGFWQAAYGLDLGQPLATSLAGRGWAAWNLEYRRVGPAGQGGGGGTPETFDDIAAGIEKLADLELELSTVVALGHSAGGHLGAWAASRERFEQWPASVALTAVISQAGVLDLRAAYDDDLGSGAVESLLGHPPGPDDAPLDPMQQLPLDIPVHCVHGDSDANVPIGQSESYVAAATDAGATAELVRVEGDHFALIDVASSAWARQLELLDSLAERA